jgi:hypothetical protein
LSDVVELDGFTRSEQEREIDHAVCRLGNGLGDPETQERTIPEYRTE